MTTDRKAAVAAALRIDAISAEVASTFSRRDIPFVILKGPVFATWLYPGGLREYGDSDFLVPRSEVRRARGALNDLGFRRAGTPDDLAPGEPDSDMWARAGIDHIDLHQTLVGSAAPPEEIWKAATAGGYSQRVGGVDLPVPGSRFNALHVVLHAAQHGPAFSKPLDDLERALRVVPSDEWEAVYDLAQRLDALDAFAAGLRLVSAGAAVADHLELKEPTDVRVRLRASSAPVTAEGIAAVMARPGIRQKLHLVAREAFPSPGFMRQWAPMARRGAGGLLVAYLFRILWLVWHAPRGLFAWRAARR